MACLQPCVRESICTRLMLSAANLDDDSDADSHWQAASQHQQPPPQPQQPAHLGGGGGGQAAKAAQQYPMEIAEMKHRLKTAGAQLPVERFTTAELLRYGYACGLLKVCWSCSTYQICLFAFASRCMHCCRACLDTGVMAWLSVAEQRLWQQRGLSKHSMSFTVPALSTVDYGRCTGSWSGLMHTRSRRPK